MWDHLKNLSYVAVDDGTQVLSNILREILICNGFNPRNSRHGNLQVPVSTYISGHPISSLQYMDKKATKFLSTKIDSDFRNALKRKDDFTC